MNVVAELVLLAYLPAAVAVYFALPPRRATLIVFIGGWLFLPVTGFEFQGIPNYTKMSAIALAVVIGTLMTQPRRILAFVPRWFDVPILIWCLVPFASSLSNGLGVYDGLSNVFTQTITWGIPWLMGRVWFSDAEGMRELAMGIFIGGLVYVPLCLFEIRMSPQLHNMIYGSHPSSFIHMGRFGGWRPLVFMQSGLALGLWMTAATLSGIWLWASGHVRQVMGAPATPLVIGLAVTAVLCKSLGALVLLAAGAGILYGAKWTRLAVPALIVAAMVPAYMYARTSGSFTGGALVDTAALISENRAESLQFRLDNEDLLIERALERSTFGWGGWGRARVMDEETGRDLTVTDGLWIITLGQNGMLGLVALTTAMLLPIVLLWKRCPARLWRGPPAVMAVVVLLFMADSLFNAMPNPIYVIAAGAVCGMPAAMMRAVGQASRRGGSAAIEPAPAVHARPNSRRPARGHVRLQPPPPGPASRQAAPHPSATPSRSTRQRPISARTHAPDPWGDL